MKRLLLAILAILPTTGCCALVDATFEAADAIEEHQEHERRREKERKKEHKPPVNRIVVSNG